MLEVRFLSKNLTTGGFTGLLKDDFVRRILAKRIVQHPGRPARALAAGNAALRQMGLGWTALNRKDGPFGRLFEAILAAFAIEIIPPPLKEFRPIAALKPLVHRAVNVLGRSPENAPCRLLAEMIQQVIHTI